MDLAEEATLLNTKNYFTPTTYSFKIQERNPTCSGCVVESAKEEGFVVVQSSRYSLFIYYLNEKNNLSKIDIIIPLGFFVRTISKIKLHLILWWQLFFKKRKF